MSLLLLVWLFVSLYLVVSLLLLLLLFLVIFREGDTDIANQQSVDQGLVTKSLIRSVPVTLMCLDAAFASCLLLNRARMMRHSASDF